jgi:type VI secretion system protein ImpA
MPEPRLVPLDALLAPISAARPGGSDISLEPAYAAIKEARRADDAYLARGDWQTELKQADWAAARELAIDALCTRSKDLQIAAWLVEALTRLHGFRGLAEGLDALGGLLRRHWDHLHPSLDDGPGQRAARVRWIATHASAAIGAVPLVAAAAGGYAYADYAAARQLENVARRDPQALVAAVGAGKLTIEGWQRALAATPTEQIASTRTALDEARVKLRDLTRALADRFGEEAPSLDEITRLLDEIESLLARALEARGAMHAANGAAPTSTTLEARTASSDPAHLALHASPAARDEALAQLDAIARFFRRTEPHSPVALLCEKAAHWARLPFEDWLAAVIKDEAALAQVREVLGIRS